MSSVRSIRGLLDISAFGLLVAAAFLASSFHLHLLTSLVVYALAIISIGTLAKESGQLSLGHGAFFAVGAYAFALSSVHLGLSFYSSIASAVLGALAIGAVIAFVAARLEGPMLALATFSASIAVPRFFKAEPLTHLREADRPQFGRTDPDRLRRSRRGRRTRIS